MSLLEIRNLKVSIDAKSILRGISLKVGKGEVHAIMGPNGSGKSTLAQVIAGNESYEVEDGSEILFEGQSILDWSPEERAQRGIFVAFQYPVEIPGLSNLEFLQSAVNEKRKSRGESPIDLWDFEKMLREKMEEVGLNPDFVERSVNEGFSGGEKKRNEIVQMAILQPVLAVLDETDSGLDIDALKSVAEGVNKMRSPERGFLVITHYQRLLNYLKPDYVHVLYNGRIVKSGSFQLAIELEQRGYDWLKDEVVV
ncbi:MAG: Fe-S cluster assembly ATPase SufC [Candidatus Hydrogenedentes bacterium]|nr:Fe-S cluster assembly ATPase SufC [Candidatus Hydrogenedentota bacterium]